MLAALRAVVLGLVEPLVVELLLVLVAAGWNAWPQLLLQLLPQLLVVPRPARTIPGAERGPADVQPRLACPGSPVAGLEYVLPVGAGR